MKQNILKALLIAVVSLVLSAVIFAAVNLRAQQKIDLKKTCIAARDIPPRTQIREDDIIEISVPSAYLQEHAVNDPSMIIGRYTDIQGKIPAGSLFYDTMLFNAKDLPDYPTVLLKKGQSAYTLETDIASLGASITAGIRVDIYCTLKGKDGMPVTGELIENARVIAVKDHKGLDVDCQESDGTPYMVVLAVNSDDLALMSAAEAAGDIRLFTSSSSYKENQEASRAADSPVISMLMQAGAAETAVNNPQ